MVNLYLVRHGDAENRSPDGTDGARPLSVEGRRQFGKIVTRLKESGVFLDRIYHSPLVRAAETAELMKPLLRGEMIATAALAEPPGMALLQKAQGANVALVGHVPFMSELLALLVTGTSDHGGNIAFSKGSVAWLEGEARPGGMILRALLAPKFMY